MAAYFIPRRSSQATPIHAPPNVQEGLEESILTLDPERSIYLFPNPSSIPPSPSGSSLYSVPTDLTISSPGGSRERTLSHTTDASGSSYVLDSFEYSSRDHSRSLSPSQLDVDVEVWDWTADSEGADAERTLELEAAVERMSRWDIYHPQIEAIRFVPSQLNSSIGRPPLARARIFDALEEGYQRARADSNISYKSLSSYRSSDTPHPRIRIPLLSFFASWLGLDLDDPALRLLTTSSSDSILFPGQSGLLGIENGDESQTTVLRIDHPIEKEDSSEDDTPHGILRLFVLSNEPRNALKSIKNGLGILSSPVYSVPAMLNVPNVGTFFGLSRFVGSLWRKGGDAVHQLQGH
ncbi:hypothetical protein QCA50_015257 [Cerrena zonata]|uniref:Uncharacterized protein n=1 Tax=Cerrena zonata TaxID=2478898 RepID=A0AAW0FJA8_9APHY